MIQLGLCFVRREQPSFRVLEVTQSPHSAHSPPGAKLLAACTLPPFATTGADLALLVLSYYAVCICVSAHPCDFGACSAGLCSLCSARVRPCGSKLCPRFRSTDSLVSPSRYRHSSPRARPLARASPRPTRPRQGAEPTHPPPHSPQPACVASGAGCAHPGRCRMLAPPRKHSSTCPCIYVPNFGARTSAKMPR
jgi:hypothetical protein